jgi:hypothetical protein
MFGFTAPAAVAVFFSAWPRRRALDGQEGEAEILEELLLAALHLYQVCGRRGGGLWLMTRRAGEQGVILAGHPELQHGSRQHGSGCRGQVWLGWGCIRWCSAVMLHPALPSVRWQGSLSIHHPQLPDHPSCQIWQ